MAGRSGVKPDLKKQQSWRSEVKGPSDDPADRRGHCYHQEEDEGLLLPTFF